ncbi:MAG: nucleotidyltransferase domain-containing protein [Chloroflexota bacterium]
MSSKVRQVLRKVKKELLRIYGGQLDRIILYGSQARGDAAMDSDIDILLVMKDDFDYMEALKRSDDQMAALSLDHDVVISRAFVSKREYLERQSPFLINVRRDGVAV